MELMCLLFVFKANDYNQQTYVKIYFSFPSKCKLFLSSCKIANFQPNQKIFFLFFSLYKIDQNKMSMNICSI